MSERMSVDAFRSTARYLPPAMRDFHDQKDVFKAIHATVDVPGHEYAGEIDWIAGHNYVVDIFLWFMAAHGYTLQKSRADVEFRDLRKTVEKVRSVEAERLRRAIGGTL